MNLMINTYCNLNCSYCFADPTMKEVATKNMSLEDFEYALSFLEKVGEKTVRLIGGEPTISPNLELFIDKITKKNYNVDTQKIRSERGLPDAELRLCALADT